MAEEINVSVKPTPVNPVVIKGAIAFSAEHARIWAEGTDGEVEQLGGEHSAKGWAEVVGEEGTAYTDQQIALAKTEMAGQIATASQGAVSTANAYTDAQVGAEATARGNADLILQGNIDSTQTALNNCVKKNESPTLNAGDEYVFNFQTGSQRAKLELTGLGFELKNETTGAEINLRSYDDVQIQAPQDGNLSLIQKGEAGARIELIKDITINSASGREIEIKQRQGSAIKVKNNGAISFEPVTGQAVYVNNNPVITTNDKATTSALGVVKVDGETISANDGVISVTPEGWQKPADWVDIRSGALNNSVYFLVGHSTDYATYPTFAVYAEVSTSGNTYDVYVDGIKQATTASGSVTTLNWQTLALTSGWDVTTPSSLRTHIVRVTPTTSTDTLTAIRNDIAGGTSQGILWAHFTLTNALNVQRFLGTDSGTAYANNLCQVITSTTGEILVIGSLQGFARGANSLQEVPVFNLSSIAASSNLYLYRAFYNTTSIKKIVFKNGTALGEDSFYQSRVKEIITQNAVIIVRNYFLENVPNLKRLPNLSFGGYARESFTQLSSLEPTFLSVPATSLTRIDFYGTASAKVALKGLTVSDQAPFTGSSPQINVRYTDLDRAALVNLFNSMPTVSNSQVCDITGTTGAADLTAEDLAIATNKGWTITR